MPSEPGRAGERPTAGQRQVRQRHAAEREDPAQRLDEGQRRDQTEQPAATAWDDTCTPAPRMAADTSTAST